MAFGFVLLRGDKRGGGRFGNFDERLERLGRRFGSEAENFHGADQVFAVNQRNIADRANGAARIDVGIIFALELWRGLGDGLESPSKRSPNKPESDAIACS